MGTEQRTEQQTAWDGWQARAALVPDGWKPVPVEPTPEMLRAGYDAYGVADCYGSMLAAAPSAPVHAACPRGRAQPELTQAARDVLAERQRQIEAEGWTPEHDDQHDGGELIDAAICYAIHSCPLEGESTPPKSWPWAESWWKPGNPRRNLIKAIALLLAEAERQDRARAAQAAQPPRWRPCPIGMPDEGPVILLMQCGQEMPFTVRRDPATMHGARPIIGLPADATHWRPA